MSTSATSLSRRDCLEVCLGVSLLLREGGVGITTSDTSGGGRVELVLLGTSSIAGRGWSRDPIEVLFSGVEISSLFGAVKLVSPVCLLNQNDLTFEYKHT